MRFWILLLLLLFYLFFNQLEENGEIPHHQFVFWRQNIKSTQEQTCRYNCGFCLVWRTSKLHFLHHLVKLLHSSSTHTHGNILKKYQAFFSYSGHLQIHRAPEAGHRNSILFFLIKALVQSSQADFWSHYCHVICITSSAPYSELLIYQKAVIHVNEIESLVSYETFISKQQAYPVIINKDTEDANCPW